MLFRSAYLKGHPFFGCTTGRVANRVAKGKFTLNGKEYQLAVNNGPNHLHGGVKAIDKRVWKAEPVPSADGVAVRFSYLSPDGEEGYPGNLNIHVTYTLTGKNELRIDYEATTDKDTPVNLTNHSYFNLGGAQPEGILNHQLTLFADHFTAADDTLIPTGEIKSVKGTPLDFTKSKAIGQDIGKTGGNPNGYDMNFVINGGGSSLTKCARVEDPKSGRVMEILTTEPGVQFYTGNFLDGKLKGKAGETYDKHHAFCLETQHYPDSVNHPQFPSTILKPGQKFTSTTVHRFSTK